MKVTFEGEPKEIAAFLGMTASSERLTDSKKEEIANTKKRSFVDTLDKLASSGLVHPMVAEELAKFARLGQSQPLTEATE